MTAKKSRPTILRDAHTVGTPEGQRPGISTDAVEAATRLLIGAKRNPDILSAIVSHEIVAEFERAVAMVAGARHAIAVSSGTLGLVTALAACGVGPGDEVVIASYGWGSTVAAVLALGAVPVFADIDSESLCLDPKSVSGCVGPRTRVIVATHLFGLPADVRALSTLAESAGVRLVFDAAQALGATAIGRPIGSYGDATVVSLGLGKLLGTGEGGVVLTSDATIAENALLASQHPSRALRDIASRDRRRLGDELSLSARLHPLAAAIGLADVGRIGALVAKRRATCERLARALAGVPGFRVHDGRGEAGHAWHTFAITYCAEELDGKPSHAVLQALRAKGVPAIAGPVRVPIHLRPRFAREQRVPLGARSRTPVSLAASEARCNGQELMLESTSRWLAVPEARVIEIAETMRHVAKQFRSRTRRTHETTQ